MSEQFLIEKRGLYYRPEARGYTGLKREAGRYSFEEAAERVGPNGPDGPQDGMGIWSEDDAPEFSRACAWDLKLVERTRRETIEVCRDVVSCARETVIHSGVTTYVDGVREGHRRSEAAISALLDRPSRKDPDISYPAVQAFLDRHVLQYMHENSGGRGHDWTAFHLRCFVNDWITKDMARAICRSLTDRGFARYERGLWNEDGETAGAGYRITDAGREYLNSSAGHTR